MKGILATLLFSALATAGNAGVLGRPVDYTQGTADLEGYLAYDDAIKGRRPGVLVVHEWWGVNAYAKSRVDQLARLGYVALAADIYGKGIRAATREEAMALARQYRAGNDRTLLRARAVAGLETLRRHPLVDPKRIAAIGYCFGGTTVLELARSGADLAGVVSFHGGLDTPNPDDAKNIKSKVLVLTGADDPHVPPAQINGFMEEMRNAGVDWYLISYSDAVHAFTNPASGTDKTTGVAYNEKAERRSWVAMNDFFAEIFGENR